jgi:glycosyltransferase involved in cell wall biosynthesis
LTELAFSRAHTDLLHAASTEPVDLFYGGTSGALAAAAGAARRAGVPYALDLEDFHTAEQEDGVSARLAHALVERIERAVLPGAAFVTAASEAIAAAYRAKYGVHPLSVNNTLPLPPEPPDIAPSPGPGLRLYWFSQTIGPGRGLEDATRAMGKAGIPGELHVRGRATAGYLEGLERLAAATAPRLRIIHHEPAPPDAMVDLCSGYDVGLALEQAHVLNRALCLTNKAFTYMLGGLALVLTDTPGQRPLGLDVGDGAILYLPGDVQALAAGLKRWAADRSLLGRARGASWQAARRRWHWEHPAERGALLGAVARALSR